MEVPTMVTHQDRTPDPSLVDAFASMIRGQVLSPGDPEHDDGRSVRNGMIDRRPALIVRASGTRDAVTFAREQRLTSLRPRRRVSQIPPIRRGERCAAASDVWAELRPAGRAQDAV
jgi:hypothetical protein